MHTYIHTQIHMLSLSLMLWPKLSSTILNSSRLKNVLFGVQYLKYRFHNNRCFRRCCEKQYNCFILGNKNTNDNLLINQYTVLVKSEANLFFNSSILVQVIIFTWNILVHVPIALLCIIVHGYCVPFCSLLPTANSVQ